MIHTNKKSVFFVLSLIVVIGCILAYMFVWNPTSEDLIPTVTQEELAALDTGDWRSFTHPDFGYTIQLPTDWLIARTFSPFDDDASLLVKDQKKQTLALSSGDKYHIYLFPEGGYHRNDVYTTKTPLKTEQTILLGKSVVKDIYDEENVVIRFNDYHDFRIQIYVNKQHKDGWILVEKILSLMNIDDVGASLEKMNSVDVGPVKL